MRLPPFSTRFALRKGDDSLAARRRLLAVSGLGHASFEGRLRCLSHQVQHQKHTRLRPGFVIESRACCADAASVCGIFHIKLQNLYDAVHDSAIPSPHCHPPAGPVRAGMVCSIHRGCRCLAPDSATQLRADLHQHRLGQVDRQRRRRQQHSGCRPPGLPHVPATGSATTARAAIATAYRVTAVACAAAGGACSHCGHHGSTSARTRATTCPFLNYFRLKSKHCFR